MIRASILAVFVAAFSLTSCGGGGHSNGDPEGHHRPVISDPAPEPEPETMWLLFPVAGFNCPDHYGEGTNCDLYQEDAFEPDNIPTYNLDALPQRGRDDEGLHQPVYHDHSQLYGIGVHDFDEHRRIFVGLDIAPEQLPDAGQRGMTQIGYGMMDDGVDRAALEAYLTEALDASVVRWESAPVVELSPSLSAKEVNWVVAAVELVNAALPPDTRMRVGEADGSNIIDVNFRPYTEFAEGTGATTWNTLSGSEITASLIHVKDSAFAELSHRHFVTLIAHELIHALGLGHVSPDFDTIMEATREVYRSWQGYGVRYVADAEGNPVAVAGEGDPAAISMPMSLVYPIDREALQVLYTRLNAGADPLSFGSWEGTSLHVAGAGQHASFGVAVRNGLAHPWAQGHLPYQDIASNGALSGSATWTGTLLGFTPAAEAVAGDAEIGVNLGTLAGRADFTSLETWAAEAAPGEADTGAMWLDGDLGYSIAVRGNTFRETGGDDGTLTGIFTGRAHEGAAGTLERPDLTAAFGASR